MAWRSSKQSVVSRSSAKSELRALAHGVCERMWLQRMLKELKLATDSPIKIKGNSKSAIAMVENPIYHERTKHVEIDKHFIKEKIDMGIIDLAHIPAQLQVDDVFTKPLARALLEEFRSKLGMTDIYSPA